MPQPQIDYRTMRMVIRVTPAEKQTLIESAERAGITPTDYIRTMALGHSRDNRTTKTASVDQKFLAQALGILGDVGSDLKEMSAQIAAGDTPLGVESEYALGRVVEASEAILKALDAA